MIASVYIKNGNIHLYNEGNSLSSIGGLAYELGKPLLDFVCYEPERFEEAFTFFAEAFENEYDHIGAREPEFIASLKESVTEAQKREIYVYFYHRLFFDFIYNFIDSPRKAIEELSKHFPAAEEKLRWAMDFVWPVPPPGKVYADKEKRLFRAAKDVVAVMYEHIRGFQKMAVHEIEVLLHYRKEIEVPDDRPIDYIDILDEYNTHQFGKAYFLERPFKTFYGRAAEGKVEQLYAINSIEDFFRFEFIKMIEHDIFIKKCKSCERFFIPQRRVDAEYCNRIYGDTQRRCNEIGAMLRYEKKVAENPVWEAYKKAYRRFNSRTRAKKMTQSEFMAWSDEAVKKRDECLAEKLPFEEFVAWLEKGRIRKSSHVHPIYRLHSD